LLFLTLLVVKGALLRIKKKKNTLYLSEDQEGYVAVSYIKEFVGKEGVVVTPLRPSGNILVENKMVQAVSCGEYIEKNRVCIHCIYLKTNNLQYCRLYS